MGEEMVPKKRNLSTSVKRAGMNTKATTLPSTKWGHNVEPDFFAKRVDHTLLNSVPKTRFHRGMAFVPGH